MGGVCGVAVESDAVRISYFRDGQRIEDSMDAEGARGLLNGKLVDCGPFDDVVLTGRDPDAVESLLASLDTGKSASIRTVDEGAALLAYARSNEQLAGARSLLVLDLGRHGTSAFTLDVAAGTVARSARRSAMSGESLDDVVERLVMDKKILPPAQGPEAQREYRAFFRELKELVTTSAGVRAPGEGPMLLTRDEFERAITPSLKHTLTWATPEEPDAVLLIGGGSRVPLVRRLVEQQWSVPVVLPESPSSVILEGATLEATPTAPNLSVPPESTESPDDVVDDDLRSHEAATTPIRLVPPMDPEDPAADAVPKDRVAEDQVSGDRIVEDKVANAPKPSRGRLRWSVRDAAGLAAVAAVVLLVWAVVVLRGDTPPPPGIGVDPAGNPTSAASVAEAPPAPAPGSVVPAPDPGSVPVFEENAEPTGTAETSEESTGIADTGAQSGADSGVDTGQDVGN